MADCPEPHRRAFLELLGFTLVYIRTYSTDARYCLALADHVHNVPALLADFEPERLRYYWEVERECFLRNLAKIGRTAPAAFAEPWEGVELEYRRFCVEDRR